MKPADRQKMCSNCDGRIAHEAMICPYCGSEQAEPAEKATQAPLFTNQSLQDSLTSLYTPPYSQRAPAYSVEEPVKKRAEPFKEVKQPFQTAHPTAATMALHAQAEEEESAATAKGALLPILLLCLGSNLFVLGILQFFFSSNGFLRLEWDASYWFVYCLLSLPLLYLGIKRKADKK
ncbi:MAG: hypothetical protein ACHQT8_06105 [Chlamydiales bacterium]